MAGSHLNKVDLLLLAFPSHPTIIEEKHSFAQASFRLLHSSKSLPSINPARDTGRPFSLRVRLSLSTLLMVVALLVVGVIFGQRILSGNPDPLAHSGKLPSVMDIGVLVFREGLECLLVLAAIASGVAEERRFLRKPISLGVCAGFLATGLTWIVAIRVIDDLAQSVPALQLQAATGLLAVLVLLLVMNWFFHKVYWTGWISLHNQRKRSLLSDAQGNVGSRTRIYWGLALLGFTSLYREGFEVVLFLQGYRLRLGSRIVAWGALVGLLLSAVVAVVTFVANRRLPYRRMLVFTGILLGAVLIVMVGEQAQEMQQAHWIPATRIPWLLNRIPSWMGLWFSIFPTQETLLAQAAAAALVLCSYFVANHKPKGGSGYKFAPGNPNPTRENDPARSWQARGERFADNRCLTKALSLLLTVLVLGLLSPGSCFAQRAIDDDTHRVLGRVSDPSGLAISGATITLRQIVSGSSVSIQSGQDGRFVFPDLVPGNYSLTADVRGLTLEPRRIDVTGKALDLGVLQMQLSGNEEKVIVSASRVNELQDEAPTKVLSIPQSQIQDTGYERVGDVLSEIPGVVTRVQSYGVGLVGGEQIDGMDSKETAVLLDGLPFVGARGIDEGYIDLNQQDVGKLDRIEVVKGAASALYGTDALGGVINLISHEPTQPFEIDATSSGSSLGEIDSRVGIGGRWKKLDAFLDLEHHQHDSYTLLPDDPTTVGAYENRQDGMLKLRYTFDPSAAIGFTSTAYANHDRGFGFTTEVDPDDPNNFINAPTVLRSNDSTQTYALVGDFAPAKFTTLQLRGYSSQYNENSGSNLIDNGVEGSEFDPGNLREIYRRADATIGQQWGHRQFLQGGYEWAWDQYSGDNRLVGGSTGQEVRTSDVWLQDRIQPTQKLLLTLGGRYQNNSSYGGHAVPKLGAVYRFNDHFTVRGAFGEGFRAPNLGELYYHLLHLEYGYQVIGNPTLRPETSQSYSGGGTFTTNRLQVSLNLFRNNLKNLIDNVLVCDETAGQDCSGQALVELLSQYGIPESFDYDTSGAALFTFINLNVDRAYTQGFDVDSRVRLWPVLVLSGAYTYLEAVDSITNSWLPFRNRHQGYIKLEYARPRWGLTTNIRGTFFSRWPTQTEPGSDPANWAYGYQIWSFYLSKALGHGVRAFGAIDNLANSKDQKLTQSSPSYDRPDYGRTFRVGLNYIFPQREP